MKVTALVLSLALFSETTLAAWGLSKAIYNKWHETELERWLSDHNVPYPTPADRKDLENLVKDNWEGYVVTPYEKWDTQQKLDWLQQKGVEISDKQAENADWLKNQVQAKWYETEASAEEGYGDVKAWIFDTWTDSQLKSFLDYHKIPSPKPRTRDALLSTARANYATIAQKAGETAAYPGDWLFQQWSDGDLKKWLDEHGYYVYQGSKRNELISAVRRNSRQATLKLNDIKNTVAQNIFNSWSDSELKSWCDKNGIAVPQNGKRDEVVAFARKNVASLTGDTFSASVTSAFKAYGSATGSLGARVESATDAASASATSAANVVADYSASATDAAYNYAVGARDNLYDSVTGTYHSAADKVLETWSESRLKAYLDARGVPVPQTSRKDELVALARLHKYKAVRGYNAWTFDTWTIENLKEWLKDQGQTVSDGAAGSRDDLIASAQAAYASASSAGGEAFATVTSALAQATTYVKDNTFETWSDSELKAYLDSYGVKTYQGSTKNELVARARRCRKIFESGWKEESAFEKFQRLGWNAYGDLMYYLGLGKGKAEGYASQASQAAARATDSAKQEL
ncbi:hypothetical protein H072_5909 [Dactylellina haptotyla CBS 200.50]|uniref:Stress response protein ish1 n=1 Tax=Dactylellina haptotyla (strain CBS 200.50) TaxID=1284197 RepID=S8BY62_DACHA|nr:hypothetical protein H072_5909 [Dactylellina haptotyla CBS 200.50]